MATRLEIAKGKLARLQREYSQALDEHFALWGTRPMGQPFHMNKPSERSFLKKADRLEYKAWRLAEEIEAQTERVERLEWQEHNLSLGLNRRGHLRFTVDNIDNIEKYIEKAERGEILRTKATIRTWKKKLAKLKEEIALMDKQQISEKAQELIDSGELTQWKKHPHIYFVKDMRKTALELKEDGTFEISKKYPPQTEIDKKILKRMLG